MRIISLNIRFQKRYHVDILKDFFKLHVNPLLLPQIYNTYSTLIIIYNQFGKS